jgi:hypothetical protein
MMMKGKQMDTMPAGRYYVGDLCYVMHDVWDEVCDLMFPHGGRGVYGKFKLNDGREFAVHPTAYGDGTYRDDMGREYSVDAGVIGCILESDIRDPEGFTRGGQVLDFIAEFDTWEDRGVIRFGVIAIDTAGNDDEDEDYFDQEEID